MLEYNKRKIINIKKILNYITRYVSRTGLVRPRRREKTEVQSYATFWWRVVHFSTFRCCWGRESDRSYWTGRYKLAWYTHLFLGTRPQNPYFWTFLNLLHHRGSCKPSKISWTILLLSCNQLHIHRSHNKYFCCFYGVMAQFKMLKHKFSN